MSVARPSSSVSAARRSKSKKPAVAPVPTRGKAAARASLATVEKIPTYKQKPNWLRSLLVMQLGSNLVTLALIAATLAIYAGTVYTQQLWARGYRKLENLQRQERQMTAANEVLKNQLAQQAENPDTGLVPPKTANTIFLPPAPQAAPTRPAPATSTAPTPEQNTPLGY